MLLHGREAHGVVARQFGHPFLAGENPKSPLLDIRALAVPLQGVRDDCPLRDDEQRARDEGRDAHLRSADFFDVEAKGDMTFKSTGVKQAGDDYVVTGDLTIKGTTRPVELALEFNGVHPDPWGGTRAGFSAETEISRKDFGVDFEVPMDGPGVVVGDKIKVHLEVEAVLQA